MFYKTKCPYCQREFLISVEGEKTILSLECLGCGAPLEIIEELGKKDEEEITITPWIVPDRKYYGSNDVWSDNYYNGTWYYDSGALLTGDKPYPNTVTISSNALDGNYVSFGSCVDGSNTITYYSPVLERGKK